MRNNLKFKNFDKKNLNNLPKKFWYFCLNNARFRIGINQLPDEKKCYYYENHDDLELVKIKKDQQKVSLLNYEMNN